MQGFEELWINEKGIFTGRSLYIERPEDVDKFFGVKFEDGDNDEFYLNLACKKYDKKLFDRVLAFTKKLESNNYEMTVFVDANNKIFDMTECENFIDFEDELDHRQIGLKFKSLDNSYSLNEVLNATEKTQKLIDELNNGGYSPFEKYLKIYSFLTSFVYNDKSDKTCREIYGVLNNNTIVCVGYSDLLKTICDKVGLECYVNFAQVTERKGIFGHQNNIIRIKDEKYGIDGYYYCDSCWDSINENKEPYLKYNFCLLPFSDINKIKDYKIVLDDYNFLTVSSKDENKEFYEECLSLDYDLLYDIFARTRLTLNFDKTEKLFNNKSNYLKRKTDATEFVKNVFKKYDVPANIYMDLEECPTVFLPSKFISFAMYNNFNQKAFEEHINDFKLYHKHKTEPKDESTKNKFIDESDYPTADIESYFGKIDDIYLWLDDSSCGTEFKTIDDLIYDDLSCFENIEHFTSVLANMKNHNKPVSAETFKKALKAMWIIDGMTEDEAERFADRAIQKSIDNSEKIFDEDATNCFRTEKLKRRQLNAD